MTTTPASAHRSAEPASFRDPEARVVYSADGEVLRELSPRAREDWEALSGEPWAGYRQFCMLFLYPLMLQAYRGIAPQPWLRGSLEGIEPSEARALLPRRRRGVLTHVVLHDRLEAKNADRSGEVRAELKASGFRKELIEANVKRLQKLVRRLQPKRGRSTWAGYREAAPYEPEDAERKERFVREAGRADLAWDLGCNDGRFSRAVDAEHVVAVDGEEREVADRDDPMVKRLLAAKRAETHESYGRDAFERALGERFEVERREELGSGMRTLYLATPR